MQASSFLGKHVASTVPQFRTPIHRFCVKAEHHDAAPSRRSAAVGLFVAVGGLLSRVESSDAAYGEAANVFGKITDTSGYIAFEGNGFALKLPSQWNPSKERDFPGTELRYEDNFDPLSHVVITKNASDKGSIDGYGGPDKVLEMLSFMIGKQVFFGETQSEGGFKKDKVSRADLLEQSTIKDGKGRTYYKYDLLVRAADGNEGGRHVLLTAAVGGGNLFVQKVQCGDKRWFKGAGKQATAVHDSFSVV